MIFNKQISYEVLVGQDNRWILDTTHDAKSNAMTRAQSLLETNQHEAVRVTRLENDANEQVIFHKECTSKVDKPITISAIEESAVCNVVDDICSFQARKTAGRLLRKYLDEWGITALELFHNHGHIRQLTRMDTLYDQALHRVASIQARALGEKPAKRNDTIYKLASDVENRARKADDPSPYLKLLKDKGLSAVLTEIDKSIAPKEITYFTGVVLATYLDQKRDWKQKLVLVLDLLEKETGEQAVALLDQICAEILDGSEAVKDLLGPQADLVSALRIICQLSKGTYKKSTTPLGRFNAVMMNRPMPYSQAILLERVARAISGTNPLTRENDAADRVAFFSLFQELIGFGGFLGGVATSEAVTRRIRIVMKKGNSDLSPDSGIDSVLSMLPNSAVKIGYLLDLSQSEFGGKYQVGVLKPLMRILKTVSSLSELLPPKSSLDDIFKAVDDMRQRIGSGSLGQEIGPLIDLKLKKLLKERDPETGSPPATPPPATPAPKKAAKGDLGQRLFNAGDTIFNEGDAGDEAFMIVSGEVEISIKSSERVIILATLGRGQIIGEMALVDNQPRMATAKTTAKTVLTVIPQEAFRKRLDWLAGEDRLISHLLEIFVDRLRKQASNL